MGDLLLDLSLYILDLTADPFFLLIVFVVGLQYYRVFALHKKFHGTYRIHWGYLFGAILVGLAAGYLGSVLLVLIGISIDLTGPIYLWGASLTLFLLHQRFLCFAYSGGVICLCYLLFGVPQISVPQVLGLIAILHLIESLLIFISGHWDPLPVYYRRPDGRLVGAFVLQKFWPLPLVALANVYLTSAGGGIATMPGWWPVLIPKGLVGMVLALTTLPAALGYGDLATSSTPRQRAHKSALLLGCYSLILLGLAYLSVLEPGLAFVGILFSPLGHEAVIWLGRRQELRAKPLFEQEDQGVKVLDVLPETPAYRAGIRPGDTLISVNNLRVNTRSELTTAMRVSRGYVSCTFLAKNSGTVTRRIPCAVGKLGVITVPECQDRVFVELNGAGPLLRGLKNLMVKTRF